MVGVITAAKESTKKAVTFSHGHMKYCSSSRFKVQRSHHATGLHKRISFSITTLEPRKEKDVLSQPTVQSERMFPVNMLSPNMKGTMKC